MAASTVMKTYNPAYVPPPFGLRNTGNVCWLSSLLQAIVSAPQIVETTLAHRDYLSRTRTGRAFYDFVRTAVPAGRPPESAPFAPEAEITSHTAKVHAALLADLGRRPATRFGNSQECAAEGLGHLLDMMDAPDGGENPIARLFYHRYECSVYCGSCKAKVSQMKDVAVQIRCFDYDTLPAPPACPAEFGKYLRHKLTRLEDYHCEKCKTTGGSLRQYVLKMIPEVIVVIFNLFDNKRRVPRYFPQRIPFPGIPRPDLSPEENRLVYLQVGQIEHFGSTKGDTTSPGPGGGRSTSTTTRGSAARTWGRTPTCLWLSTPWSATRRPPKPSAKNNGSACFLPGPLSR